MSLQGLLERYASDATFTRLSKAAADDAAPATMNITAPPGARAPLIATAAAHRPILAVVTSDRVAEDLFGELTAYIPEAELAIFPSWETLPHERLSPRSDTVGRRVAVLRRLTHPDETGEPPIRVLIAPVRSVMQPLVKGLSELLPVTITKGQETDPHDLATALTDAGYSRVDMVEKRGEFAVRGGIVDVFGPQGDHPVRIDFFGDEVDELRYFSLADQRSLEETTDTLWAPVVREVLLTDEVRGRARDAMEDYPGLTEMLEQVADGTAVEGMESLMPILVDEMEALQDILPPQMAAVVLEPDRVKARSADLVATSAEFLDAAWATAAEGGRVPVDASKVSFFEYDELCEQAADGGRSWWGIGSVGMDPLAGETGEPGDPEAAIKAAPRFSGRITDAIDALRGWVAGGTSVVVTCAGRGSATRMVEQLAEADVPAAQVVSLDDAPAERVVTVTTAQAEFGVVAAHVGVVHVTEADIFGRSSTAATSKQRMAKSRRGRAIDPVALTPGDFVVHEQHGVGKFVEMTQRTIQGATREYLVVEYASSKRGQPADRLFVPSDTLDQVSRYVGGESPSVNKLGGGDWAKTKAKARKAVKEIAGELIRLYSARMASKGHAYGPDTPWQRELEEAFPFVETRDQLTTIDEVKEDMEKPTPMDRLVCGDVGFGKTEIAVRAAFKAIQDGKQVAVLVPTTLLVKQHFETFSERYAGFPVKIAALSRFQSSEEADEVVAGLADGTVDLVIGTHRLLSASVRFKSLGMVIIDEEQRFGVEHKETLKKLRVGVDVLAMSATPIPRTLEMAVTGIREMSTLETPPEERHPILTYVGEYEEKTIAAAIRRELLREGQVFFVHNRVESIERVAKRIRELVPDARVATAHGRMGEKRLEDVIVGFWEKRFDVLVTTTIVETGLDIANANTLIVDRADAMGLSQLHQLRGRVGRGRERAYAYFLYPPEKPLNDTSYDRLATIAQNSDLGAGMAVARKDLEIRGAGNLLGGQQSGHIAGVGFDLYVRLVREAVTQFSGDVPEEMGDVKVELPVDAHLPYSYIEHEQLRLEAYRKISAASTEAAITDVAAELQDRYGQVPEPVENLLRIARLRVLARSGGIEEIQVLGSRVKIAPVQLAESQELKLRRLYPGALVKPAQNFIMVPSPKTASIGGMPLRNGEVLDWAMHLLRSVGLVTD